MDNWKLIYINILLIVVCLVVFSPKVKDVSSPSFLCQHYHAILLNSKSHL